MDAVTTLLSQLSIEGIILVIILFAVSIKFLGELFEYIYTKLKHYFNVKDEREERHSEVMQTLHALEEKIEAQQQAADKRIEQITKISNQLDEQDKQQALFQDAIDNQILQVVDLKKQVTTLAERTQDSTRAYLIDKHHHFCYQVHGIDDMSLQDMERRFMYYKAAGGNTFVDALMEDVRALPRLTVEHLSEKERKED